MWWIVKGIFHKKNLHYSVFFGLDIINSNVDFI